MLESQYFRSERPRKHHRRKAITGILLGLLLVIGAAVGGYYTFEAGKGGRDFFVLLMLPGLIFSVWGCGHLARHRGYPTYAAYLLFGGGLALIGGLIAALPGMLAAKTAGLIFVFATMVPTVVLMSLPVKKDNRIHRRHRREPVGF